MERLPVFRVRISLYQAFRSKFLQATPPGLDKSSDHWTFYRK
jgi:hypothetical protein